MENFGRELKMKRKKISLVSEHARGSQLRVVRFQNPRVAISLSPPRVSHFFAINFSNEPIFRIMIDGGEMAAAVISFVKISFPLTTGIRK